MMFCSVGLGTGVYSLLQAVKAHRTTIQLKSERGDDHFILKTNENETNTQFETTIFVGIKLHIKIFNRLLRRAGNDSAGLINAKAALILQNGQYQSSF